jgi:hypothetical protein
MSNYASQYDVYTLNGHRDTIQSKTHVQHVVSEPHCALHLHIFLTAKTMNLMHDNME